HERLKTPELVESETVEFGPDGKRRNRILVFKGDKTISRYDEAGHQIESVTHEANGQFRGRETSQFDAKGLLISTPLEYRNGEKGAPVVSVDAKKKELVGNYKNGGREWQPKGRPEKVQVHDFPDKKKGKTTPVWSL